MLLVLLSWCYILLTCFSLGFALDKLFRFQVKELSLVVFLGLFAATILGSSWAIFDRINIEFHIALLSLNISVFIKWKKELTDNFFECLRQFSALPIALKCYLGLNLIVASALCSAPSYFVDNEIYYIQTIKWLNEYGFVKGLANLHLFFGQTGGWHIAQSVFSFSFLGLGLNNLNGFCLLVGNFYGLSKWDSNALGRYLPMAGLLLFPFVGVPSPALAIGIISFVLFCLVVENDLTQPENFNVVVLLSVFIAYMKVTALPIVALPIALYFFHFRTLRFKVKIGLLVAIFTGVLFIVKNLILTGYPFFPSRLCSNWIQTGYALPSSIYDFAFNPAKLYDFVVSRNDYHQMSYGQVFLKWVFGSGKNSLFNSAIILMVFVLPFFIRRFFNQIGYWTIYGLMLIQLCYLLATSPQYRFMLHFLLFFGLLIFSVIVRKPRTLSIAYFVCLLPLIIIILFPFDGKLHNNSIQFSERKFAAENLLVPNPNSNLKTAYHVSQTGNLHYFSPDKKTYFWATGDAQLPCVNQKQVQYFERQFGYRPQQRTASLKDGFYSQKVSE